MATSKFFRRRARVAHPTLGAGLAHLWELDSAVGFRDMGVGLDLTLTGSAEVAAGPGGYGTALRLNGLSYLSASDVSLPAGNAARSVAVWCYQDAAGAFGVAFHYGTSAADQSVFLYRHPDGRLAADRYGQTAPASPEPVASGEWFHLTLTVEPGHAGYAVWSLYVDGLLVSSGCFPTDTVAGGGLRFGMANDDTSGLAGRLRQGAVYGRVLSPQEAYYLASPHNGRARPFPFLADPFHPPPAWLPYPYPAAVWAAFLTGSPSEVALESGRTYWATQSLNAVAAVALNGNGAAIHSPVVLDPPFNWRPIQVVSPFLIAASPGRAFHHAQATVTAATTSFTLLEWPVPDPQPGDRFLAVLGVGTGDVLYGQYTCMLEVASFADNGNGTATLVVADPVGVDVTVWPDEAALDAAKSGNSEDAVGPWGQPFPTSNPPNSGPMSWGLGEDHGFLFFVGGQPIDGPSVTGVGFSVPDLAEDNYADISDGGGLIWAALVVNGVFSIDAVHNSPVIPVFLRECFDCEVTIGPVSGIGVNKVFQTSTTSCPLVSVVAGGRHTVTFTGDITGSGWGLYTSELYPTDVTVRFAPGVKWYATDPVGTAQPPPWVMVQAYWSSPGTRFENLTFAVPVYLTAGAGARDIVFENLTLEAGLRVGSGGDRYSFPTTQFGIEGTLTIEENSWAGPAVTKAADLTFDLAAPKVVRPPTGLVKRARFRVISSGGMTDLNDGHGNIYTEVAGVTRAAMTSRVLTESGYAPGSPEYEALEDDLQAMSDADLRAEFMSVTDGGWVTPSDLFGDTWCNLPPSAVLPYPDWLDKVRLLFFGTGSCRVEFDGDFYLDNENGPAADEWAVVP